MISRSVLLLLLITLTSSIALAQCSPIEFDSKNLIALAPDYVEGIVGLSPGSFFGVQISQPAPLNLVQVIPHIERQLINCYQKPTLATVSPLTKDYSAGAGSMPVNLARLSPGMAFGGISSSLRSLPSIKVVAANAPLQITTNANFPLPGDAYTGLFVDLNKDGFLDIVVVTSDPNTNAGGISVLIANGDGTFKDPVNYTAGVFAGSVAAGDFNGDGNIDLAVATSSADSVLLLLGDGAGAFRTAAPAGSLPPEVFAASLAAADLNGDGHLDLAVTTTDGLYIFFGNGSGSFTVGPLIPSSSPASFVAIGDFNLDGKPDLAVALTAESSISVFLGNGDGTFAMPSSYLGATNTSYLIVTDVNGDGKPDILVAQGTPGFFAASDSAGDITTLLGNGDGTFQGSRFLPASNATSVISADVNGDGKPDLIASTSVTSFGGSANQVVTTFDTFLNLGNGNFSAPILGTSTTLGGNLAAADFNGDGKIDLAIAGANVSVLFGKGDGTFLTGANIPGVASAALVAAGDFNGDGKPDLIVGSTTASFLPGPAGVAISLNTGNGTFAAPANLGGSTPIAIRSGTFNAGLINPAAIVAADFNRDGKLDFALADGGAAFDASQPGGLIVFLGNGNGTFQDATELPVGVNPTNIAVGDLNGDGIPDIALSTGGTLAATPSGFELAVLIGNGDGTFKLAVFYPTEFGPAGIAIADMNGDGKPDLVIMHCCGDVTPAYLIGNGDGTFQSETAFQAGASPGNVVATDLNNDGKPDLAVVSSYGVGVLINHSPVGGFTSVSAAGFVDVPLTPNSIVSGFGAGLASASQPATTLPLPTQLAGASISIKDSTGVTTPAPLFFASPLQVNYLVPANIAIGAAQLSAASSSGTLTESLQVVPFAPTLFLLYSGNLVAGYLTRVTNGVASTEPVYQSAGSSIAPRPVPLPTGSDQLVLTVFGTGLRDYQGTFYAMVGNQFAPVLYAGSQGGFLGLDQVNIQLPSTLPSGTLPIEVGTFTGGFSNTASILIQ